MTIFVLRQHLSGLLMKPQDKNDKLFLKKFHNYKPTKHQQNIIRILEGSNHPPQSNQQKKLQMSLRSPLRIEQDVKIEAQSAQESIIKQEPQRPIDEVKSELLLQLQKLNMIRQLISYQTYLFEKHHTSGKQLYDNRLNFAYNNYGKRSISEMYKHSQVYHAIMDRMIKTFLKEKFNDLEEEIEIKKSIKHFISQLEQKIREESTAFKVNPIPIYLNDEEEYVQQSLIDHLKRHRVIVDKVGKNKLNNTVKDCEGEEKIEDER